MAFLPRIKCLLISWPQSLSAVILESRKIKSATVYIVSLSICHEVMGLDAMILVSWMLSFKPTLSLHSFTFIKRSCSSFAISTIMVVSSSYLKLLICLSENLDSTLCFIQARIWMMYSGFKLNKQGDNIQPWRTPFLIWNQSVVLCPVLTVTSWPIYRFLRRLVRWSDVHIS